MNIFDTYFHTLFYVLTGRCVIKRKEFSSYPESSTKVLIQQLTLFGNSCFSPGRFAHVRRSVSSKQYQQTPLIDAKNSSHCCMLSVLRTFSFVGVFLFSVGQPDMIQLGRPYILFLDVVKVLILNLRLCFFLALLILSQRQ